MGAEHLNSEILLRYNALQIKYDIKVNDLTDYQILEIYQNKNVDVEFKGILEKVSAIAVLVPCGGEYVQNMLTNAKEKRDKLALKRKNFLKNLQETVIERDIFPDKMKNSQGLKTELPKFSGYDSKMDIFTIKSEFQKLVEPTVQKMYWVDYLKRIYLSGQALLLNEKETDYAKIWARLMESFGNSRLLLQNKLGTLDKNGGLWKVKGNERIGNAIAGLINSMTDLSALASDNYTKGLVWRKL